MKVFRSENHDLVNVVLRFAVGAAFLWFGIDKWVHPDAWSGYFPNWVLRGTGLRFEMFLNAIGAFEFASTSVKAAVSLFVQRLDRKQRRRRVLSRQA